jgi:hypothetical protein
MKALKFLLPLAILLTMVASIALAAQWTGWILDKKCAEAGMHEGDHSGHVSVDSPIVFLSEAERKVFTLTNDGGQAQALLGKKIAVEGDLDKETIRVTSIKVIPETPSTGE